MNFEGIIKNIQKFIGNTIFPQAQQDIKSQVTGQTITPQGSRGILGDAIAKQYYNPPIVSPVGGEVPNKYIPQNIGQSRPVNISNNTPGLKFDNIQALQSQPRTQPTKPAIPTPTPIPQNLWDQFTQQATQEANQRGYDAETIIKQKALESDFGRSNFAQERNNFGGIGAYDRDPNQAFKFDTIQDYLNYYFKLIESRYPEAYQNRQDPEAYIQGLKQGGYATDPDYVWKVLNTPLQPR